MRCVRPGGPAIVKGFSRRLMSCASRMKKGMPPKWSPCKWEIRIVSIAAESIPARFIAISDEAPQSIRKRVVPAST